MTRDPDAVLAELGADLERAWRRGPAPRRRDRLRRRGVLVGALLTLLVVPTAVGTRDALWAPDPPPLPPGAQAPGPVRAGSGVYVAAGRDAGVPWRLSAMACDLRSGRRVVGVFLTVPGGGAGARCDVATASPQALAARLVHTYFDPVAGRQWVFGALPAGAAVVEVAGARVPARPADARAVGKGRLPRGLRVFVTALPADAVVGDVVARDARGRAVARCRDGRCVTGPRAARSDGDA